MFPRSNVCYAVIIVVIAEPEPVEFMPTGSIYLDWCFGGGLPIGRFTILWGPESTGKSTLALLVCKATVLRGGFVAYIDVEAAVDPIWAGKFGMDSGENRHFFLFQPESAEEALNTALTLMSMKRPGDPERSAFDLIVLDSVAALATKAELAGVVGDNVVAARAQLLAQFLKISKKKLSDSTTSVLLINQERDKFGVSFGYGEQMQQPGGRSVRFYPSIVARMKSQGDQIIGDGGEVVGRTFRLKTTKNKVSRCAEADIKVYFDTGTVDVFEEFATIGKELGVFTKEDGSPIKGACNWFFMRDEGMFKVGKGISDVADRLDADRELAAEVDVAIRAVMAEMNKVRGRTPQVVELEDESGDEDADELFHLAAQEYNHA